MFHKKNRLLNTKILPKKIEIIATEICDLFTVQLRSDGIIHTHVSSQQDFTIESLKKFNVLIGQMLNYKKAPLLVTGEQFAFPTLETRQFWAKEKSCVYSAAEAFVATNFGHKLIGNFYLKINKPQRPTNVFSNEIEALKWLKLFL
jgi:hypothetical protein